jgi:hypothetical protein
MQSNAAGGRRGGECALQQVGNKRDQQCPKEAAQRLMDRCGREAVAQAEPTKSLAQEGQTEVAPQRVGRTRPLLFAVFLVAGDRS